VALTSEYPDPDLARPGARVPQTLASDADRDAAAARLNDAFAQGRLTADEHGERIRAAYDARTWTQLSALTADLPTPSARRAPVPAAPAPMRSDPDRCLLCALLIACPPAGIAWLLASRHHARAVARTGRRALPRGGADAEDQ
jgi:hypothetical protein